MGRQKDGDVHMVEVRLPTEANQTGMTLSADVPAYDNFSPLVLSTDIGILPRKCDNKISFRSSPHQITPGTTTQMSMTCSLNNEHPELNDEMVVNSIRIIRGNGEEIAKLSNTDPSMTTADLDKPLVEGSLESTDPPMTTTDLDKPLVKGSLESAFLELTWQTPNIDQIGKYTCEIEALDKDGNVQMMTSY